MGEKGNLLDMGEEIFANLAEQGPQFWLNYKQYMESRGKSDHATHVTVEHQAGAVVERDAAAQDAPTEWSAPPSAPPATE
jgi:hypothetical protein